MNDSNSTAKAAATAPYVTARNYVRAESDFQLRSYVEALDCFGRLHHARQPYDVKNQITVRGNRDTLYSFGVFDLDSPITVALPETHGRYQSLMSVSQDHSIRVAHGPGDVVLTQDGVGTRHVLIIVRTFADPADEADMAEAHRLQDEVRVSQADVGRFEVPPWSRDDIEAMRNSAMAVAEIAGDSSKMFGVKEELDPVYWLLGAAVGWGGLPAAESTYLIGVVEMNDGETPHALTVRDVPVDAFWSVTVYDREGWLSVNPFDAYSFNSVTAKKDRDGATTIRFGGDPAQPNYLPIVDGWNYIVRMYRPRDEILNGSWRFPEPVVLPEGVGAE